ncbi:hypothetical protein H1P_2250008 [Hyella patelloides LEGE 07179]|uniref:Uncharacterized protein n=1 Tax=Hyella patelloides LEGE 07179 TaxID=945734 RepID=A0A563VR75_9CYAN|nr:hypothetical protein H1P_2250008 [Hyella patelloides LEGE 07179]
MKYKAEKKQSKQGKWQLCSRLSYANNVMIELSNGKRANFK